MQMVADDYISLEDAIRVFGRSREWLYQQIRAGKLRRFSAPGDRRIYLSRKQLTEYLRIRPVDPADNERSEQ